jgi:alpha-ketoglutarate-dependent taurine dioxygenase
MTTLHIQPITPVVGAVASGVDLTWPLDLELVDQIRRAVLDQGVVFFRGQDLTRDQMAAFMRNFGPLCTDPFSIAALRPPAEEATVHLIPTYGNRRATAIWHMDSTLAAEPAALLALRAVQLPQSGGGDTCWGSMVAAYETLSEPVKEMIDGLSAEHSAYKTLPLLAGSNAGMLQEALRNTHPVVIVHPETQHKALYVNELWTERLVGVSQHESDCLLAMLWKHSQALEFTMRRTWQVNEFALWDNRSFQHYAVMDYQGTRVLQKSYVVDFNNLCPIFQ